MLTEEDIGFPILEKRIGGSNSTIRVLREVDAERQVTITSGEMYPE